jgi:hypothetical protein
VASDRSFPIRLYLKAVVHHILVSKSTVLQPCYLSSGTSHCFIWYIYIYIYRRFGWTCGRIFKNLHPRRSQFSKSLHLRISNPTYLFPYLRAPAHMSLLYLRHSLNFEGSYFHFILYLLKFGPLVSLTHETHTCDFRSYYSFLTTQFSL